MTIIKQQPDDFQVEELTHVTPGDRGVFGFYRLEKTGWTTPDALAAIRRRWKLDLRRLSYGGLKDRHAHTIQYLSIFHGPRRNLRHQGIEVTWLGQIEEPYSSHHIRANRFQLMLRRMTATDIAAATIALEEVRACGVPNYFDDQRFGSVASGTGFMARHLLFGRYEEALRQVLTAPYEYDRAPEKKEKSLLRQQWGDWPRLKDELPRGHARSLISYLADHPGDFRGAVARLRPELRGLYLSAYQSHLWNHMLVHWLHANVPAEQLVLVSLKMGEVPMPRRLSPEQLQALTALHLPLHSARIHLAEDDPRKTLYDQVLAEEGVTIDQFKLKGLRDMFFSKGERPAWCLPAELQWQSGPDETRAGHQQLRLRFDLPRGSYATLLVKRIQGSTYDSP
ncbi:MAG: tRNA pseudouridine(13) synthase TruD [Gemmataceae bacterium]|nr:tRNA pseudouridine(13) synthase TruD [Gemmataceae bacterium]